MSRADLARQSGLQRSTVSAIVDQLIDEGWVTEGAVGRSPRGRRPRNLHLNVERAGILGVELRPETTTVGLAGVDARFMAQATFPTAADSRTVRRRISPSSRVQLRRAHPRVLCEGMGVSLPGRVDEQRTLVFAPNLGWGPVQITQMIEAAVGLPVNVENAANACALAELWFGRHPEHIRHIVAVTVSEGIGVGLLLNGQLVHGAGSMAGEFGHVSLDEIGPALPLRTSRLLGTLRVELGGRAALSASASGAPQSGAPTTMRLEDLARLAAASDSGGHRLARSDGPVPRAWGWPTWRRAWRPTSSSSSAKSRPSGIASGPLVADGDGARALPNIPTRIVATDPKAQPRLRGAVTLVVQQHFGAPVVA